MPQPGTIWHTIRHANGAWQPAFVELEPLEASDPGQFTSIGAGGIADELELVAVSQFIQIWRTARHHDGTWQPDYLLVGSDVQRGFPSVDCAGVASELHVVTVDGVNDGGAPGNQRSGRSRARSTTIPGSFSAVGCAGVGGDLHVVGVVSGELWHTIRHRGGSWQPTFGLIESHEANSPLPSPSSDAPAWEANCMSSLSTGTATGTPSATPTAAGNRASAASRAKSPRTPVCLLGSGARGGDLHVCALVKPTVAFL